MAIAIRMIVVALVIAMAGVARPALAESNVMFIVDASGSMKKQVDGEARMTAAKRVLAEALADMPPETRLGLLLYGHRHAKDCSDIELAAPIGAEDAAGLGARIGKLKPKGETPIAAALELAAKSFIAFKGQQNSIVLVTDGIEECQGDPCAAARAIREAGLDLKVNIVGFTLKDEQRALIQCVADETGGTYYDAKNVKALGTALKQITKEAAKSAAKPAPAPAPVPAAAPAETGEDILAQANGGRLVAAPNADWAMLNDGKEERAVTYTGGGIWAFKDGKPATFDRFELLIPASDGYNVKDFELFAGDEGPTGAFRSIGKFTAQNIKMMKSPYQQFKFPPVTARYFKVELKTDQGGGYIATHQFRLHGEVDTSAPAAAQPAPAQGIDLLAPANGGTLVSAPNDEWQKLTDGDPGTTVTYSGEGTWSFAEDKPATFDRFEIEIVEADHYNVKDFELFVGDEPDAMRSLGTFSTQNVKFFPSDFQVFTFPPATGRYFRVAFKTDWGGGYISGHELRLFGTLGEKTAEPAAVPIAAGNGEIDLLAQANGGTLLAAPNDEWMKLNDGLEDRAVTYEGEGTWAFAGEKPATFDAFELLIPETDPHNVKDFELLAGDEGPGGAFRSIGTFTVQNMRMVQAPYQRFTFAPVTAKYLKVVLKTDQGGGYIAANEFRLLGSSAP